MLPKLIACPICKTLSINRALCSVCAAQLFERREPFLREEPGFTISSLFSWERDGWLGLRWWIAALKQKEHEAFWREPAIWALDTFQRPKRKPPVLIPVPSTNAHNHAKGFAKAIAHYSGWPVLETALKATPRTTLQKKLDRQQRQQRSYTLANPPPRHTPIIIVDDVVTTGATSRAAFRALNHPKDTQVWCLMDRRPCES